MKSYTIENYLKFCNLTKINKNKIKSLYLFKMYCKNLEVLSNATR